MCDLSFTTTLSGLKTRPDPPDIYWISAAFPVGFWGHLPADDRVTQNRCPITSNRLGMKYETPGKEALGEDIVHRDVLVKIK